MEERDDYTFMTIKDAILAINQKVNLIGVVVEWGFPKQSKGSDSFCSLKILDESRSTPGISVNIFAENVEKLPRVVSVGDIIQLSHVMIKTHNGEAYALFNKKFSSFALYEGKNGEDFLPYQVSLRFRPREQDKKFVGGLRKWLTNFQLGEDSRNIPLLREIKKGERMDLACKILHICEVAEGEWMAFVWDGTDTPPNHIHNKLEDEMDNQLPLQLEPLPLSRDILHSFPTVGSILRVIIDQVNKKHVLHLLNTGKWMIFLNVLCQVNAGLWYGVLTHFTRLRYMPSEDPLILERQRPFEKRLSIQYGRMSFWSFPWISRITEVDYNDDKPPFVTLMDVLNHQKDEADPRGSNCKNPCFCVWRRWGEKHPGGKTVDASVRKMFLELIKLSETAPDPSLPKAALRSPKKEKTVNHLDDELSRDVEMKRGDWMCPKCNFMNFSRNTQCRQCKEDGPKNVGVVDVQMKKGDWTCSKCNFMNFSRNKRCLKCKADGPDRVEVNEVEKKKGDWDCPQCGFLNFSSNKKCLRCPESRPKRQLNPGEWECPSCDFLNYRRNRDCLKCNGERPKRAATEYEEQTWSRPRVDTFTGTH